MGKIILLIGILGLILVSACNKETCIPEEVLDEDWNVSCDDCAIEQNVSFMREMTEEEWQQRCWEETMWMCQEHCSRVSGLIYSDLLTIDIMQFDYNNDTIIDDSERKEMDYIKWRNDICMDECIEEEVYDCFR